MGCNCGGKKKALVAGGAERVVVYQILNPDGSLESEHEDRVAARARVSAVPGARFRTITRLK